MRITIIAVLILFLSGCGLFSKPIEITTKPIEMPKLILPNVDRYSHLDVEWIIITPDNYEEVFQELNERDANVALIGVTDKGYENLSINTANMLKILRQYQAVVNAYKEYYILISEPKEIE
jgi:Cys-tRNA synthase (O-phospho-L-seryl-tRNA:Cys-tRNA synthase)